MIETAPLYQVLKWLDYQANRFDKMADNADPDSHAFSTALGAFQAYSLSADTLREALDRLVPPRPCSSPLVPSLCTAPSKHPSHTTTKREYRRHALQPPLDEYHAYRLELGKAIAAMYAQITPDYIDGW